MDYIAYGSMYIEDTQVDARRLTSLDEMLPYPTRIRHALSEWNPLYIYWTSNYSERVTVCCNFSTTRRIIFTFFVVASFFFLLRAYIMWSHQERHNSSNATNFQSQKRSTLQLTYVLDYELRLLWLSYILSLGGNGNLVAKVAPLLITALSIYLFAYLFVKEFWSAWFSFYPSLLSFPPQRT